MLFYGALKQSRLKNSLYLYINNYVISNVISLLLFMIEKPEYAPLLDAGFHTVTLEELKVLCVDNFHENNHRNDLFQNFILFLKNLDKIESKFEIWVDGSFTTNKLEPADIDILIVYDLRHLKTLPIEQQDLIKSLFDRDLSRIKFNLDVLLCEKNDEKTRSYWRGWFGYTRKEVVKGIAKFEYGY